MIHPEETLQTKPKPDNEEKKNNALDVDEYLQVVGQFNKFQILLLLLFCFIIIPPTYQTLAMSFVGHSPPWRCVNQPNSSLLAAAANVTGGEKECLVVGDVGSKHDRYKDRCNMDRRLWRYTRDNDYSIVTQVPSQ